MKILLVNQSYAPDESATAQYAKDLADELSRSGCKVTVLTSKRGYLNTSYSYPRNENLGGVNVVRVSSPSITRRFKFFRILDAFFVNLSLLSKLFFIGSFDSTVVLTSPPLLGGFFGLYFPKSKGKLIHWAMDINPDQAIRAGWIKSGSWLSSVLVGAQVRFYTRCDLIVVLDRFMKELLLDKGVPESRIVIVPLWWGKEIIESPRSETDDFKKRHAFSGKKIVMYAGNHSLCHPLDAMLLAALKLRDRKEFLFVFSGGGGRVQEVSKFREKHSLSNIVQLPYQSRENLPALLDSADVQVVSCGEEYVGVVHPSKVYPFLALDKPFILLGANNGSVVDIIEAGARGSVVDPFSGEDFIVALECLLEGIAEASHDRDQRKSLAQSFERSRVLGELIGEIIKTSSASSLNGV